MITYEQDPDVVRWGLQLFESDPYSNNPYCQAPVTHHQEGTDYSSHFSRQDQEEEEEEEEEAEESNDDNGFGMDGCNVENDELVARSLQMELSGLAVAGEEEDEEKELAGEESVDNGASANREGNVGISGFQHDCWLGGQQEGAMAMAAAAAAAASSSCSATLPTQGENSYHEGEWSYSLDPTTMTTAAAVADDYYYAALDGEVGEWLNEMVPIPHVPRINGEIPSIDEATLDHQRLLERLQVYDLVERKVQGDGNCQFRALSDQLYRTTEHHEFVRQEVVNQLKSYPEVYEGYVPMAYGDYLEKMSKSGEWGDHVTLQAAADSYGVKIIVMTSFKDTCYIEILPNVQRSKRVILLSFWAEVHYNSIFQKGDVPEFETKKKKRWRMFRNKHLESPDIYQGVQ